jgi:hypothetical protein
MATDIKVGDKIHFQYGPTFAPVTVPKVDHQTERLGENHLITYELPNGRTDSQVMHDGESVLAA